MRGILLLYPRSTLKLIQNCTYICYISKKHIHNVNTMVSLFENENKGLRNTIIVHTTKIWTLPLTQILLQSTQSNNSCGQFSSSLLLTALYYTMP